MRADSSMNTAPSPDVSRQPVEAPPKAATATATTTDRYASTDAYDFPPTSASAPSPGTAQRQLDRFVHLKELLASPQSGFKGSVHIRHDLSFEPSVRLFNSAAPLGAWMVARPRDTRDVAAVINFCREHSLSPSIKSGGYATAGWAIHGDVVVDMSLMDDVSLMLPSVWQRTSASRAGQVLPPKDLAQAADAEAGAPKTPPEAFVAKTDSVRPIDDAVAAEIARRPGPTAAVAPPAPTTTPRIRKADEAFDVPSSAESAKADDRGAGPFSRRRVTNDALVDSPSPSLPSGKDLAAATGKTSASGQPQSAPMESSVSPSEGSGSGSGNGNGVRSPWVDRLVSPASATGSGGSASGSGSSSAAQAEPEKGSRSCKGCKTSNAGGSASAESSSPVSVAAKGPAADSAVPVAPPTASSNLSSTSTTWNPKSSFEHERWQRHHQPPLGGGMNSSTGASAAAAAATFSLTTPSTSSGLGSRIPSQGGFIWREGLNGHAPSTVAYDGDYFQAPSAAGASDSTKASGPSLSSRAGLPVGSGDLRAGASPAMGLAQLDGAPADGLGAMGAEVLLGGPGAGASASMGGGPFGSRPGNDLAASVAAFIQREQAREDRERFGGDGPSSTSGQGRGQDASDTSTTAPSSILAPGLYKDKYLLASFGPGAGIRGIDSFTARAGHRGAFKPSQGTANGDEDGGKRKDKGKAKAREGEAVDFIRDDEETRFVYQGVPYHIPLSAYPVGSTSLTTGGFGFLTRAYGLSVDNIVEIEMMLADGSVWVLNEHSKTRSETEKDLWFAARGAAPCFGVVTRIIAKAYPVPSVYAGNLIYPLNPITAPSLVRHWRDCLKGSGVPRELYANLILTAGPDRSSHVIVIQICYLGPKNSEGEAFVQAISSWNGERVLLKDVEERSFLSQQDGVAKVLKSGEGRRWMVRGDLLNALTDEAIGESVSRFSGLGNRAVWLFELMGGAVQDVGADETCFGKEPRAAKFTVGALQQWTGEAEDEQCSASVDQWVHEVLGKSSTGGPFSCFLERGESRERCQGSFGKENFERLLRIKRRLDPGNVFRHTFGEGLGRFVREEDERKELEARGDGGKVEMGGEKEKGKEVEKE